MKKMTTKQKAVTFSLGLFLVAGAMLPVSFAQFGGHGRGVHAQEDNVQVTKENITNGVVIQKTSSDQDTVKRLQAHTPPASKDGTISFVQENIANGVKLTITSSDANKVKEIQEGPKGGFHEGMKHMPLVKPTFESLSNGVALTFTSDDQTIVTKLKADAPIPPFIKDDSKVTVQKDDLSNGVKITLTSTDAETIKKLQDMPNHKPGEGERRSGGHKKHGLKKMQSK